MEQPPVILVGGPTASGKSNLALQIAEQLDGVLINADAIQTYRDLFILTARPSIADEERVNHELYGFLEATDSCSAGQWQKLALSEIASATAKGKRSILVGGTGLYLKSLVEGIAAIPEIPSVVRASSREYFKQIGKQRFHAELLSRDPVMGQRISFGDSQRMIRAWEVFEATGQSLSYWQGLPAEVPKLNFIMIVLIPPREEIYIACEDRLDKMISAGVLKEVRQLSQKASVEEIDPSSPIFKAIGYTELSSYLEGKLTIDEALLASKQKTRRYAKRQMTWFRNQFSGVETSLASNITILKYSCVNYEKIFSNIS